LGTTRAVGRNPVRVLARSDRNELRLIVACYQSNLKLTPKTEIKTEKSVFPQIFGDIEKVSITKTFAIAARSLMQTQ
jgi:hypothetical protein